MHLRLTVLCCLCLGFAAQAAPPAGPPHPDSVPAVAVAASSPPASGLDRFLKDRGWAQTPTGPVTEGGDWLSPVRDGAKRMVHAAMGFLGVPYVLGGNTQDQGFDCSGFTRFIFEKSLGLVLPRRADEQARSHSLLSIPRDDLKPGDLVFFNTMRRTFSHVGIYVGEGKFIHAPRAGQVVRVEDLRSAYWSTRFTGARRAPVATAAQQP